MKKSILICAALSAMLASCGGDMYIDDVEDDVESVEDGNTIVLSSGLTVKLLGISPQSAFCEEYLRSNMIGRPVNLVADKVWGETFETYDDEIYAYVYDAERGEDLNRKLLTLGGEKAFNGSYLNDSLEAFKEIIKGPKLTRLDNNQLSAKLKGASMLIYGEDAGGGFIGTGFFINENGLALTNNHVISGNGRYKVFLSDTQGNIDFNNAYYLNRIVATSDYRRGPDYTIFYVNLDDDSKKRLSWLPITKNSVSSGDMIATVGNPAPGERILTMSYAPGTISGLRPETNELQINAPITHGFSGGPLVNEYGEVVGISSSGYDNNNANLNFAVDIKVVRDKLDELNVPYAGR